MQPISRNPQPHRKPVRFGSTGGNGGGVGGWVGAADTLFRSFQNSRGKEMIVEDVVGFGVLRTGMDLHRNKMYGDDSLNVPAATERFFREITSIFTDSVLGGIVAWGMSKAIFDRKNQAFSGKFIQYPSLEFFQDIVNADAVKNARNHDEAGQAFIKELLSRTEGIDKAANETEIKKALETAWGHETKNKSRTSWFRANPNAKTFNEAGQKFITALDKNATDFTRTFTVNVEKGKAESFAVNDLLDDVNRFGRSMERAWANGASKTSNWQDMAKKALKKTITAKDWSIPIGLATGMGMTFVMPFLSNWMTKKMYGIDYFPGETSLRKHKQQEAQSGQQKSLMERYFPYVTEATRSGNVLPLGFALAPLVAAFGFVDTYKLKLTNPIKGLQNGTLKKLFDFTKAAPFTSQQQMAAMFALLITSRLLSSRSDNEYKERILDSAMGWGAWIVGTPLLKKGLSKLANANLGNANLFNSNGTLKSREAIAAFAEGAAKNKMLKANIGIGIFSTLATMGILGFGAPLAGIKLTQWNEKRKQEKQNQQPVPQSSVPPTPSPAVTPQAPAPFGFNNQFSAPAMSQPFGVPAQPTANPYAFQPANRTV